VSISFTQWDKDPIVPGLGLCVLFPIIAAAVYRGVALYHGDVERIATYLMWLERKYKVLSADPDPERLKAAAKKFCTHNQLSATDNALAALTSPLGWELWLRRDPGHLHILHPWKTPKAYVEAHKNGVLNDYVQTRAFRNAVLDLGVGRPRPGLPDPAVERPLAPMGAGHHLPHLDRSLGAGHGRPDRRPSQAQDGQLPEEATARRRAFR